MRSTKNIIVIVLVALVIGLLAPVSVQAAEPALKTKQVVSVTVSGLFQSAVVQNGDGVPNDWSLGQYATASKKGAIGLLGHNYLAGMYFYSIGIGQEVTVKYSDGTEQKFEVQNVMRFKASDPNDFSKPFVTNNGGGSKVSAMQVFNQAYKNGWVTFQTCITAEGSNSWGLLFVQAAPKK